MLLSIVIPVYNEVETLEALLNKVREVELPIDREIILVDDGSTDGTRSLLQRLGASDSTLKIYLHEINQGKGAALRTGFKKANGDILLIQDADLEYSPMEYPKLLMPILEGNADVVFSSRFMGDGPHRVIYYWHYVGNKVITMFSNMMTNINLTDVESCYKVFKKEVLQKIELKENHFGFEIEVTAKMARLKRTIYEVPISYYGRSYKEGKKITWKDGIWAFWCIIKYRFVD